MNIKFEEYIKIFSVSEHGKYLVWFEECFKFGLVWCVGKYMCAPDDIQPVTIYVHVLEGKLLGVQGLREG